MLIARYRLIPEITICEASILTINFILTLLAPSAYDRTSAKICQRTTKAVIYIFTQSGFSVDVYLDDFYGAEVPALANTAFATLQTLFDLLGLASSPEKDSPPTVEMVCLGILVDTKDLTLRVLDSRLRELSDELQLWLSRERFTIKELQSLLGKLSFVIACVHASRIFLSRLLNAGKTSTSNSRNAARFFVVEHFSSSFQRCFGYKACRVAFCQFAF